MEILEAKLREFAAAMLDKLVLIAPKHGGLNYPGNVTSDKFDWSYHQTAKEIRDHLLREIAEWLLVKSSYEARKELVDIANCAFLLYEMSQEGAI